MAHSKSAQIPPVIITDSLGDFALRRLELYYGDDHRIVRSILRDMTVSLGDDTCLLADNCLETRYTYSPEGFLIGVTYWDGLSATYTYNAQGQLIAHQDPRAPIAPAMTYGYDETSGDAVIAEIQHGDPPSSPNA